MLHDMYGPSLRNKLNALIVSKESEKGGHKVNEKRVEMKRKPLEIIVVGLVDNSQENKDGKESKDPIATKLSSTFLRQQKTNGTPSNERKCSSIVV